MAIADTISSMYENVGEVYDTITNVDINNGTNLLDYSTCKIGDLNTGTGAEETSTVRIISDFIEVTPNENYICTLIGGDYTTYYYSSNKTFISGGSSWIGSGNSFTTPNNAGYLRLKFKNANNTTISLNDLSNIMLNKGSTALPYQPYTDNPTYKNIENIPSTMRNSYLEIMNNGIDTIWNNWEKVEGTGESLSLNSTEEAPMKINLKGNTSQTTYSGKNLLHQDQYLTTRTTNGITYTNNGDGTFNATGTATANTNIQILTGASQIGLESGKTYYFYSSKPYNGTDFNMSIPFAQDGAQKFLTANNTITTSGTLTNIKLSFYVGSGVTVNAQNVKLMLVEGSTPGDYEPFVGGPSPNPDYPQDIHVVSGDNSIDVCGKNLLCNDITGSISWGGTSVTYNGSEIKISKSGTSGISANPYTNAIYFPLKAGETYTFSMRYRSGTIVLGGQYRWVFYVYGVFADGSTSSTIGNRWDFAINNTTTTPSIASVTFTPNKNFVGYKLGCYIPGGSSTTNGDVYFDCQLEVGNQATTYEAYTGASYPISLGVENLLSTKNYGNGNSGIGITSNEENALQVSGTATANSNILIEFNDITLKAGTYYFYLLRTKTTRVDISLRTTNNAQISSANFGNVFQNTLNNRQFILESDTIIHSINFYFPSGTVATDTYKIMICKETHTEKEFTLYGKAIELCKIGDYQDSIVKDNGKWYLNKQIGKYTITGQESDRQYYWSSEINGIKFVLDDAIKTVANVPTYCNRFNQWYSGTTANNYVRLNRTTSYLGFWFGNITIEGVNSITTFKSYATNNQILLYYPLATPTYTEITDSTLLSQLEAVKRSYDGQTNITQVNNDLPFILDVTALKQLTQ